MTIPTGARDDVLTELLLRSMQTPNGWKCPKCGFETNDRNAIVKHIQAHLEEFYLRM